MREQYSTSALSLFSLVGRKWQLHTIMIFPLNETDVLQKKKGGNYKPFASYMETEGKTTLVDGWGFSSRQKAIRTHIIKCMTEAALASREQQNESNISSRCTSMRYEVIDAILFFAAVQPPNWDLNRANNLISSKSSLVPHCRNENKKSNRNSW